MPAIDDLLEAIFDGSTPAFAPEFEAWMRRSRRFKAFAVRYQTKIRTKLKNARDDNSMTDLRAELETAVLLLRDERFTLEYEAYAASKQRGPDYTVTFRTHTRFNVEVRRLRGVELDADDPDARSIKLMAVLCDKAGQMPPGIVNLLWLTADRAVSDADVNEAATTLRARAERKDEDYFTRRGFENAADFLRHYRHLSGIVLRQSGAHSLWLNPLARHKPPPEIVSAILRV